MKKIYKLVLASLILLGGITASNAQQVLPKGFSPEEVQMLNAGGPFHWNSSPRGITTAPQGNIRCAAEWEEIQTLVITWTNQFDDIQSQIVAAAQLECEVIIVCSNPSQVTSTLASYGVTTTNVTFIQGDWDSIWMRDYGGNTMYKNDVDSLFMVDWIYNRPSRPDDDAMPDLHGANKGIDVYETTQSPNDLVNTGGNWMSDGFGTGFASNLILDENDAGNPYGVSAKTEAQVDQIMQDWMGITRYLKMPVLPYDQIHHIDMHLKLLDEETLLWSEYPAGVADGPQIEANLQFILSTYNSMFGTPYKVIRIPAPPSTGGLYPDNGGYYRTYTNSVFVNKTVLLPFYRQEYDTTATRIYQEALPGYNIVGIDVDDQGENLIQLSGAIHCITHSIGVDDPLLISHQPLDDTFDDVNPYTVDAYMKHVSGMNTQTLYWTTNLASGFTNAVMTSIGNDNYTADIPAQPVGTHIYYYVEGMSVSNKTQVRPIVAPTGYWEFEVLGPVGIEENNLDMSMQSIFPNPANAITCIPVESNGTAKGSITLYDVLGKEVKTIYSGDFPSGESKYFLDASTLTKGAYMVVLETNSIKKTQKLMVK
jgi:agmatine deiminase